MRIHIDLVKKMIYLYHTELDRTCMPYSAKREHEVMAVPFDKSIELLGLEVQEVPKKV